MSLSVFSCERSSVFFASMAHILFILALRLEVPVKDAFVGGLVVNTCVPSSDRPLFFIAAAEHNRFGKATHRVGQEQFSNVGDCVSDIRSVIGMMGIRLDAEAASLEGLLDSTRGQALGLFILCPSCNRCSRASTICPSRTKVRFNLGAQWAVAGLLGFCVF